MVRLALLLALLLAAPGHAAVTFFDATTQPVDSATPNSYSTDPLAITPPASMQTNDYIVVFICARTASVTWTVACSGGQSWTVEGAISGTAKSCSVARAAFNGTWSDPDGGGSCGTSPTFDASTSITNQSAYLLVFRGVDPSNPISAATAGGAFASGDLVSGVYTLTPTNATTRDGTMVLYCWMSTDDNAWTLPGGTGLSQKAGALRVRNQAGNDTSISCGWKVAATTGDRSAEGNDETDLNETDDGLWESLGIGETTTTTTSTSTTVVTTTTLTPTAAPLRRFIMG